jgi:catechol 2,3-dioxygenase-like lactoylglutathione lyase family enzyme
MTVQLNHTIVHARDSEKTAGFWIEVLGLPKATRFGPFHVIQAANGVSLDVMDAEDEVSPQHYAFLVSEPEFDEIFGRIQERGIQYWADPGQSKPGQINRRDGGRGTYFEDPNGHLLEILTRPYGSGGWKPGT